MNFSRFLIVLALLSTACDAKPLKEKAEHAPQQRDYGNINVYQACKAEPRRELSASDRCAILLISQNCTAAADCLVTCESSPDGYKVGGGCSHICFGPAGGHAWDALPKIDFTSCRRERP